YLSLSRLSQAAIYRGDAGTIDMLFEDAFPRVSDSLRGWEYGYVNQSRRAEESVFRTGVGIKLAAISRDREILVTVSNEDRMRGWRIDDQKEIWAADAPGDCEVLSIAMNSAGDRVAFATSRRDAVPPSHALHIWRFNGNSLDRQTADLHSAARAVGFSPDDSRVATADDSGSLCLFDAESLTLQHTFADHGGRLCAVAFRRDGLAIATGGFLDSSVGFFTVWDLETHGKLLTATRQYPVRSLDFGPGGSDLYVGYDWGMVDIWNVASSAIRKTFWEHALTIRCIASSPDHNWFAFGSSDRRISLYGSAELRVISGHWSPVIAMQFSPDGNRLTTVGTSGFVRTWSTLRAQNQIALPTLAWAVAISPDGTLATGGAKGTDLGELSAGKIGLWDRSYHRKQTIDTPFATVQDILYSPGGDYLVALGDDSPEYSVDIGPRSLSVLNLDGREIASISASSLGVTAAAFQANDRLLIGTATGTLISAPIRALQDAATIDTCEEPITCLCASRAKGTIAYASGNEIRVRQNGVLVRTHRVAVKPVRRAVLSHDGALLAATSGGFSETEAIGELNVWRTSDGKEVLRLSGENELYAGVLGLAFSPDGKRLFVTTYEHTTSIIRVADGAGLFDLTCQLSPVIDVDMSSDGLRVATVGLDGTVVVCEATPWD
ncbi:MAG: WD40 repeat domain-containing protein, partial [Planctomycetes bacterium]|nr:WD40 repeat domain-containing protein [Planctomycetota bacterium]